MFFGNKVIGWGDKMIGLPKSTEIKKQLPKGAIYEKFNMKSASKDNFNQDIKRITIVNEISPATMAISAGNEVNSIFVLHLLLKKINYDVKNIALVPKLVNQKLLLILECEAKMRLAVSYGKLIESEWMDIKDCSIKVKGLNLDQVWENMIIDIGSIEMEQDRSLEEQLVKNNKRDLLSRKIAELGRRAKKENQPKKKYDMVQELKALQREMEGI